MSSYEPQSQPARADRRDVCHTEHLIGDTAQSPAPTVDLLSDTSSTSRLLGENCLSLAEAARKLPRIRGSKPPHPSTLFRWATQGRKAKSGEIVRLEITRVGGTNCTSEEALARFFDRLNGVKPTDVAEKPRQTSLEKQAEQAKRILRRRGLIK